MDDSLRFLAPEHFQRGRRTEAAVLWAWHAESGRNVPAHKIRSDLDALNQNELPVYADAAIYKAAREVVDTMSADPTRLLGRLESRLMLESSLAPKNSFELNHLLDKSVGEHARLLARLADLRGAWQRDGAASIAIGFELVRSVADRGRDSLARVIVPLDELHAQQTSLEQWEADRAPSAAVPLLWKQAVRAKDALSQGSGILLDLPFLMRRRAKQSWLLAVELLIEAERRHYDAWTGRVHLGRIAGLRSGIQSIVGRAAFRSR